MLSGDRVPPV